MVVSEKEKGTEDNVYRFKKYKLVKYMTLKEHIRYKDILNVYNGRMEIGWRLNEDWQSPSLING